MPAISHFGVQTSAYTVRALPDDGGTSQDIQLELRAAIHTG